MRSWRSLQICNLKKKYAPTILGTSKFSSPILHVERCCFANLLLFLSVSLPSDWNQELEWRQHQWLSGSKTFCNFLWRRKKCTVTFRRDRKKSLSYHIAGLRQPKAQNNCWIQSTCADLAPKPQIVSHEHCFDSKVMRKLTESPPKILREFRQKSTKSNAKCSKQCPKVFAKIIQKLLQNLQKDSLPEPPSPETRNRNPRSPNSRTPETRKPKPELPLPNSRRILC